MRPMLPNPSPARPPATRPPGPRVLSPLVRRGLLLLAGLLLLGVLILMGRTMAVNSRQLPPSAPLPADTSAALAGALISRLAGALRIQTVTREVPTAADSAAFDQLHAYLRSHYPLAHARLSPEVVGRFSLLFTWPGTDPRLRPLVLLAHQDVVPVEEGSLADWVRPPFAGDTAGGFLYGRGALDDKLNLLGQLEAVEQLLTQGYVPERTILLAYGHDEERAATTGGGAAQLAALLRVRYPNGLGMVLDEGGIIKAEGLAGIKRPIALVGVSEKGYLSLTLTAHGHGGHSSMPESLTPLGRVAAAVARLEQNPFPARLDGGAAQLLDWLAPEAPFTSRLALANQFLLGGAVLAQLQQTPAGAAAVRTTTAPTILQAGEKENVIPASAQAVVNFRLLPGDSPAAVLARVRSVVNDSAVRVAMRGPGRAASPVSSTQTLAFRALQRTIGQIFPEAVVAPYVVVGATDARHYASLCPDATYRFMPVQLSAEELAGMHGANERLRVRAYARVVAFYAQLLQATW